MADASVQEVFDMRAAHTSPQRISFLICFVLALQFSLSSCAMFEESNRECISWDYKKVESGGCIQENENGDCIEYDDSSETEAICLESMCKDGFHEDSDGNCVK